MKLVVDTSILFAALLKRSTVRELLLNPLFEFYVPEFGIEEIEKHVEKIADKSGLSVENVHCLFPTIAFCQKTNIFSDRRKLKFGRPETF